MMSPSVACQVLVVCPWAAVSHCMLASGHGPLCRGMLLRANGASRPPGRSHPSFTCPSTFRHAIFYAFVPPPDLLCDSGPVGSRPGPVGSRPGKTHEASFSAIQSSHTRAR